MFGLRFRRGPCLPEQDGGHVGDTVGLLVHEDAALGLSGEEMGGGAVGVGDEGAGVVGLVQFAEFAQAAVGGEALAGAGEGEKTEGEPEVFAEGGGDGFFAEEGELFDGGCILEERGGGAREEVRSW